MCVVRPLSLSSLKLEVLTVESSLFQAMIKLRYVFACNTAAGPTSNRHYVALCCTTLCQEVQLISNNAFDSGLCHPILVDTNKPCTAWWLNNLRMLLANIVVNSICTCRHCCLEGVAPCCLDLPNVKFHCKALKVLNVSSGLPQVPNRVPLNFLIKHMANVSNSWERIVHCVL